MIFTRFETWGHNELDKKSGKPGSAGRDVMHLRFVLKDLSLVRAAP